jgi:hypothetical protein
MYVVIIHKKEMRKKKNWDTGLSHELHSKMCKITQFYKLFA